jgi:inner membrane protein
MMAKSHVVVGIATWIAAAPLLHLPAFDPAYLGLAVAGSLLPDVDHPKSRVGRLARPVSTAIASVLGHRGITHSAFAVFWFVVLLLHAGYQRGAVSALAVGYLSHLGADMLTPQGLRLAWPLRGTWGLPLCRTGSRMEAAVVLALVCGVAWWVLGHGTGHIPGFPGRPLPRPA